MKLDSPLVSLIIANYNGKKWLKDFFNSVKTQDYPNIEVIFFDNGSADGSCNFVKKIYPKAVIIENNVNIGFGPANNEAVKHNSGEILFFVNNDTKFSKDLVSKLVRAKHNSKAHIIAPITVDAQGNDHYEGKYLGMDILGYPGPSDRLFYVEGCSLMISRSDFDYLGGFDPKYFLYSEEIDLCWRAHIFDMKIVLDKSISIFHYGGGSTFSTRKERGVKHKVPLLRRYEVEKNTLRNILKNYNAINVLWILPLFFTQLLAELVLYLISSEFGAARTLLKAVFWNVRNIKDTLKKRKIVQNKRVRSDIYVFKKMIWSSMKIKAFSNTGFPAFKK
ncbi:glycosyltransferase family 2 protein [Patescibacteria group bacterium]